MEKMIELLDLRPHVGCTDSYLPASADGWSDGMGDFRTSIRPKHPLADADFVSRAYYQVYGQRHGFIPNLSVLDLLFNQGNEAILWL